MGNKRVLPSFLVIVVEFLKLEHGCIIVSSPPSCCLFVYSPYHLVELCNLISLGDVIIQLFWGASINLEEKELGGHCTTPYWSGQARISLALSPI